ncbi:MAG: cardiolipin synthase [Erysipelotrichaceae bacterium]
MKKILSLIFSRMVITFLLIAVQVSLIFLLIFKFMHYSTIIYTIFYLFNIILFFAVINKYQEPTLKLPWIIIIISLPLIGGIIYLMFGNYFYSSKYRTKAKDVRQKFKPFLDEDNILIDEIKEPHIKTQAKYLDKVNQFNVYSNTTSKYLPLGETFLESLLKDLNNAKKFIFMEYFIVQEGVMFDQILEVLKRKATEGLDVRFMYDDIGTIQLLPSNYPKTLESYGIKTVLFNPLTPAVSLFHNNRDHRKITVIDGNIAYTGGLNLADEYINAITVHGHWKDVAVRLEGDACFGFTLMFLEMYHFYRPNDEDINQFKPTVNKKGKGYYIPYGDSPHDNFDIGENVYINMINNATEYVYIETPYLIIDYTFMDALRNAAFRGVDVRIITPHIADKWYVHLITRAHYNPLIEAGVKIYEYTPGYIHAKTFIADDLVGVVGTINLDYRSLIHHYECGVWMYKTQAIKEMKEDYFKTLEVSQLEKLNDSEQISIFKKITRSIIRLFAPLL